MKPLNIAVGTTYDQKINYLKEVLTELGLEANIIATKVESGVADQPMTSLETKRGSINRAKEALRKNPEADFAIGIEVGYDLNEDKNYEMFCWASIVNKEDNIISHMSQRFLLPKFHQEVLKKNLYLGDYVREYLKISTDNLTKYVGEIIQWRKPFITTAIKYALIRYLKREEFD